MHFGGLANIDDARVGAHAVLLGCGGLDLEHNRAAANVGKSQLADRVLGAFQGHCKRKKEKEKKRKEKKKKKERE